MDTNEQVQTAESKLAAATREIRKEQVGKAGAAAEVRYGKAYNALVKLGAAPKLKRKYSEPKKFR